MLPDRARRAEESRKVAPPTLAIHSRANGFASASSSVSGKLGSVGFGAAARLRMVPASREKPRPLSDEVIKAVKPYDADQN